MLNDKRIKACMSRFSCGAHTRMQFLSAVSHSMGAQTADPPAQEEFCEVCLVAPREGFTLVPCGHACTFLRKLRSASIAELDAGCPVCRAQITMMLRLFQ